MTNLRSSSQWREIFERLLMGTASNVDEQGISDEEMSDFDPQEVYTAVRLIPIPRQAAEEAKENRKVAELKDRLIRAYPRLFRGVAKRILRVAENFVLPRSS